MSRERGSVSIVMLAGTLLFCTGALAAADVGSMIVARARAQAAADAASLAAAVAQVEILGHAEDPGAAARDVAQRNGATLTSCACETGSTVAEVTVAVTPTVTLVRAWAGREVRATARAAVDEAVLTYRDEGV